MSSQTCVIVHSIDERGRSYTADDVARVVNWAYRGKSPEPDGDRGWTTERHLFVDGVRILVADAETLMKSCAEKGPEHEALLLALQPAVDGNSLDELLGTIHVQRSSDVEAEIGMFSVDPDRQGGGVGARLLSAAHEVARTHMRVERTVIWVISGRSELLAWYSRKGYVATGEKAPFPDQDGRVGKPKKELEFLRMERPC